MKTPVITFSVTERTSMNDKPSEATRMNPQPLTTVPGKFGSDLAKTNAREALRAKGYRVRSVSFSEGKILAYVFVPKEEKRKPRSATPRRNR